MSDKDLKDNSNIPILNGTNYSEWYRSTRIYLRSKDLLDVCLNNIPSDATLAVINRWKKASCDTVSFISSKIDPSVFIEVVDDETMEDAHLLWEKINEQYASKTAINQGRVVMNWVSITYKGGPSEYSTNPPSRLVYYCANGVHNPLNTTHKPNRCYVEFPHLRPKRKNEKDEQANSSPSTHLSAAHALMTCSQRPLCKIIIDSAATHHMFNNKSLFGSLEQCNSFAITTGDPASNLCAEGNGSVNLHINGKLLSLENCLYVPRISHNLISMIQLLKDCITIERLPKERLNIMIGHDTTITGQVVNGLMSMTHSEPKALTSAGDIWHHRLGNPSNQAIKTLGLPPFSGACKICLMGKSTLLPFSGSFDKVTQPLECIHIDLVGPITPQSNSGYCYFLMIVDQFTAFKFVRFLKTKDEAFNEFLEWKIYAENFHSLKIRKLVSNRGGKFENKNFSALAASCGFIHQFAPTSTPEHNGFTERANRTILDKARCLLLTSNLPRSYWAEAVNTASLLSNLMPTPSRENLSPFSAWSSKPSRIKRLKPFSCKAFILVHKNKREWKLSPTSEEGILLGFVNDNSAYKILRIRDKSVIITRHAYFVEDNFPSLSATPDIDDCSRWVEIDEEDNEAFYDCEEIEPQHSNDSSDTHSVDTSPSFELAPQTSESPEPCHPENPRKIRVIGPQHPTIIRGDIVPENILPYSRRPKAFSGIERHAKTGCLLVGTTWVFRRKRNDLNEVTKYKARLCAQGFSQTFGQDYSKTFASTGRLHSLRTLIAFSAAHKLDFQQLDIRSSFLNAPLDEKVYLSIPQGLLICRKTHCLKLKKAIYGLNELLSFKEDINKEFKVKDLGKADLMLGIKLIHTEDRIILSQAHYV
ncbi:hypothetical protein O181_045581, partial [Austropuccinia psidii MF-1]|nr:hypothetical protein [Austropuccinia psidii MF-1]